MDRILFHCLDIEPKIRFRNLGSAILVGALLFALCSSAEAQQVKKIPTVGFLLEGFPSSVSDSTRIEAFRKGLREIGYTEGKNHFHRVPVCGGKKRSPHRPGGRAGPSQGGCNRDLWDGRDPCCQACHHDDPHCHDEQ